MSETRFSYPIHVSVQIQPQHAAYDRQRDAWKRAEELGVDCIFNWDHYLANGVTHLVMNASGPDYDLDHLKILIAWRDRRRSE